MYQQRVLFRAKERAMNGRFFVADFRGRLCTYGMFKCLESARATKTAAGLDKRRYIMQMPRFLQLTRHTR
jgi:hypothetical protein